jgi:hypothetical protein
MARPPASSAPCSTKSSRGARDDVPIPPAREDLPALSARSAVRQVSLTGLRMPAPKSCRRLLRTNSALPTCRQPSTDRNASAA